MRVLLHEISTGGGHGDTMVQESPTDRRGRELPGGEELLVDELLDELLSVRCLLQFDDLCGNLLPRLVGKIDGRRQQAQRFWLEIVVHAIRDEDEDVVLFAADHVGDEVAQIGSLSVDVRPDASSRVGGIVAGALPIERGDVGHDLQPVAPVEGLAIADVGVDKNPLGAADAFV